MLLLLVIHAMIEFSDTPPFCKKGPLTCEIQAGEFEVLSSLLRESMPKLCGWSEMMDVAMKNAVKEGMKRGRGGGGGGGGGGDGGGNFSSSDGVPF